MMRDGLPGLPVASESPLTELLMTVRRAVCLLGLGGVLSFSSVSPVSAAIAYPWGGTLELDTRADVTYDTNVAANRESEEDTILRSQVGLDYANEARFFTYGGELYLIGGIYVDGVRSDYLDWGYSFRFTPGADYTIGDSKFSIGVDVGADTSTAARAEAGDVVTVTSYRGAININYNQTQRLRYVLTPSWRYEDPDGREYNALERREIDFTTLYVIGRDMTATASASYYERLVDDDNAINTTGYTFTVGLRDQLLARLNGSIAVGLQTRSFENVDEDGTTPYVSASLVYTINDLTSARLSGSRAFDTTINSLASTRTSVSLDLTRDFSRDLKGSLGIFYTKRHLERPETSRASPLTLGYRDINGIPGVNLGDQLLFVIAPPRDESDNRSIAERVIPTAESPSFIISPGLDRDDDEYGLRAGLSYSFANAGTISLSVNYEVQDSINNQFAVVTDEETFEDGSTREIPRLTLVESPIGLIPSQQVELLENRRDFFDYDRLRLTLAWNNTW